MKRILLLLLFLTGLGLQAQNSDISAANGEDVVKPVVDSLNGWTTKGNFSLLLNQSNFSNWAAGGESNLAVNVGINYDFNWKKLDYLWDNKIVASYGFIRTKTSDFDKKTDDRLEFNSILGKKATGEWDYSFFLNFKTQFTKGYLYAKDADGAEFRVENSRFFSPAYLAFGPGMLWKKNDNLKVNLAPLTSKFTFVNSDFTSVPGYLDGSYFGVDANKCMLYQLGFYAQGYYKLNLMTNVSAENTLNLFSNYLEKPQNVDIDYSLAIVLRVNRYLSANISFQEVYDDDAFEGFQTREVFGLGINFGF